MRSDQLLACLTDLTTDTDGNISLSKNAKTELLLLTGELMPEGKPDFRAVRYGKPIAHLVKNPAFGRKKMFGVLVIMVKSFCDSVNVVRNMNEDQAMEAASMLLDKCGNYRLEDYQIMFTMGKRGQLVRILDRVDINVISQMIDAYWSMRDAAAERLQQEEDNNKADQRLLSRPESDTDKIVKPDFWLAELSKLQEKLRQDKQAEWDEFLKNRRESIERRAEEYAKSQGVDIEKVREEFLKSKYSK